MGIYRNELGWFWGLKSYMGKKDHRAQTWVDLLLFIYLACDKRTTGRWDRRSSGITGDVIL